MNSSISFFLLLALCGTAAGLIKQYVYVNISMNWQNAQSYCRRYYTDLGTITSTEEKLKILQNLGVDNIQGWIGLNKVSGAWQWSDGESPNFYNWKQTTNQLYSVRDCVTIDMSGWSTDVCSSRYPFICYRSLILVNEEKSWEDALQHCRMNYAGLASAASAADPSLVEGEAAQRQRSSVWVGLHFLDGQWFWLSMGQMESQDSLPSCPLPNYRCGAHNIDTYSWENRDCSEKLSFLCY